MKQRILKGWTIQRGIFLLMGTIVIVQSIMERQWIGVAFGSYFASMGLFSFGCASGTCYTPYSKKHDNLNQTTDLKNIEFEEIKIK